MSRYSRALAAGISLLATMGWASAAVAEDVNVGLLAPLSGAAASYGTDILNGAKLAVEEVNKAGGINGRKLVLVEGDDRGSPQDAANLTQRYLSDKSIVAMIGGATSTATFGAVPVAQRGGLPFLITLASHPDLTREGNYIFRNSTTQEQEGPQLARLVAECLDAKSVGIMSLQNDWAVEMTRQLKLGLEKFETKIPIEETYHFGDNVDYTAQLAKVKAAGTDIIWFGSQYNDLAVILRQARRVDLGGTPLVGSAGNHSTGLIDVAGEAAEGLYLHTMFFPESPDPRVQDFVTKFRAAYGQDPNIFSTQAYDGMHILASAIKAGDFTREGARKALETMEPHQGVGGVIAFDPQSREATGKTFVPIQVKDGKFALWDDCYAKLN